MHRVLPNQFVQRKFTPLLVLLVVVGLGYSQIASAEWLRRNEAIMGTSIYVEIWHTDQVAGEAAIDAVIEELHRIDRLMSTFKPDSEISLVNDEASKHPVPISEELQSLILKALELSELTGGAFDITYASVGHHYNFRERQRPDDDTIEQSLQAVDYRNVVIDKDAGTISFSRDGVRIDLGGIAKGYAVERGIILLRERGVQHALISAGGDSQMLGDRMGRPWLVGIRDPRGGRTDVITHLPVADEAVSTSGDYERFFDEDGVRYHHIIVPTTGRPACEVQSVTIIGPNATITDGLSTSVFVLGVAPGLELINGMEAFETVIIDGSGKMHFSSGMLAAEVPGGD